MAKMKMETKDVTREEIEELVKVEVRKPLEKIVPIRLSSEHWAELYRYAHELGIGPTTLARMWIIERLASIRTMPPTTYEAIGATSRQKSLTYSQFIERIVSNMTDEEKQKVVEWIKDSVIPHDAKDSEEIIGFIGGNLPKTSEYIFKAIAKTVGIELITEESAKTKEPKVKV